MTTPVSPLLQALAARLEAAGPAFTLGPTIIQAPRVTDLFLRLLNPAEDGLPVKQAQVGTEVEAVILQAACDLFGSRSVAARFVFTEVDAALVLNLSAELGWRSVDQLYAQGILPGHLGGVGTWAAGLAVLPKIDLTLDSGSATLAFTGPPALHSWDLLGLSNVGLSAPAPAITIIAPPAPNPLERHPRFTSTLQVGGAALPVYLELPAGVSGFKFGLDASAPGLSIGDLNVLDALTAGGANLPAGVVSLNQFWLTGLDITIAPGDGAPTVWWFDLGLAVGEPGGGDPPVWTIIEGVLALASLRAALSWTLYVPRGGTLPTGSASGSLIGTILVADHPVEAAVTIPVGPDGWRLASAAAIPLAGLSDLAAYFGDASYLSRALAPLGAAQGFALTALSCRFHPPPAASLDEIALELTVTAWSIPALPWFQVNEIVFGLDVLAPLDPAKRALTATLSAELTISDLLLVRLEGAFASDTGLLDLAWSGQPLNPVPISTLSALVTPQDVAGSTPANLPTGGDFFLNTLAFQYDTTQGYLPSLDLSLGSLVEWPIVPDKFVLNSFQIELHVRKDGPAAGAVATGAVRGTITLAGVGVDLAAQKPTGADPWVLSAELGGGLDLDFSDLLSQVAGTDIHLPQGYGFPTALNIRGARVELVPDTGAFSFNGWALVDWSITFGQATFAVTGLGGSVDAPGGTKPTTGQITGDFAFGGMTGSAKVALGGGDTHTVITVAIGDPGAIAAPGQVDAIAGAGVFGSAPRPADLPLPTFGATSAGVVLDLTADSYLVHGAFGQSNGLYGGLALQVRKAATGDAWGYAFAAGLTNWSFARLSPSLAIVDQILSVQSTDAAIALSSLDGEAGQEIAQYVPALGPGFAIRKGVNFYAVLTFGGGLMTQVATLLDVSAKGPFTLGGYIPADAGDSVFTATLGELSLLHVLTFSNLVLTYSVGAGRSLTLTGDLAVSIPLAVGAQALSFHGAMTVNDLTATFDVAQTPQTVIHPLGMPGITLGGLGLALAYVFATQTAAATWTLEAHGDTTIGPVALTGRVLFKDGAAVLAAVALSKPLSVDAIFAQIVGAAWPAGLLDITFQTGEIWYAPAAVTIGGRTWDAGLNVVSTIDVYILKDLRLQARMIAHTPSAPGGLTAQVQYGHAIDWGFVKLYQDSAHPDVGPAVGIDSAAGVFTVRGGLALFGASVADVAMRVTSETLRGSVTFAQNLGPFGRPTLDFTWDDTGFHVDNWPLSGLRLPDFSFDDIRGSGDCASVVISKLPIKSKFNLTSKLSITATPRPALRITITGTFDLVCNSAVYSGTILTANIGQAVLDVPLPLSGSFDWNALGEAFVDCIKGVAQSVFQNLVEDPANLAKLLAVGGVEFAVGEVASYLICRGTPQAAAEAFAEAAVGAVATEVVIEGVAIAVGGVAGAIIGGVFHNSGTSSGGGGGGGGEPRPDPPGRPGLAWSNGLKVSWGTVAHANSYVVAYRSNGGGWTNGAPVGGSPVILNLPPGPLYGVVVVAAGPGGVSAPGPEATLQTLAAPGGLAASYADGLVGVTWTAVPGADPRGYQVSATLGGQPLSPPPVVTVTSDTSAILAAAQFDGGGDFVIAASASSSVMTGPAATTPLHIGLLPAPTGLALTCVAQSLVASWTPVAGATAYRVQVRDAQGHPLSPQPRMEIDAAHGVALINGPPLADSLAVQVVVAAAAPGMSGTWSAPAALTLVWLTAPTFSPAYDEAARTLTIAYADAPPASGCEAEVLDQAGAPLQPPFQQVLSPSPATFPADRLAAGQTYRVRVCSTAPGSRSAWAEAPPLDLAPLAPPTGVVVVNETAAVTVSFQPSPGATTYEAEIVDASGHVLNPPLTIRGPTSPLVLPADRLSLGSVYGVRLRAILVSGPQGD